MENKQQPQEKVAFWSKVKIAVATLLLLLVLLIIIKNWNYVSIDLVFKSFDLPLTFILFIALAIGYFWGTIGSYFKQKRNSKKENLPNE